MKKNSNEMKDKQIFIPLSVCVCANKCLLDII